MTMIELLQNCWGRRPGKPARTDGETNMPMRPGAARQTAALDGRVVQPDASQGAMRLRALEVEALARASAGDDYALPSRPESRKRDIVGWITVAAILYGGAF